MLSMPFGLLFAITGLIEGEWERLAGIILMLLPVIIAYPITFAALLLLGVPLYLLLSRLGPVKPFASGALGAICGASIFVIFIDEWIIDALSLGVAIGALTGAMTSYLWAASMARRIADQPR